MIIEPKHTKSIRIGQPYLPNLEKYQEYVRQIFERGWLTNDGPFVDELEHRLTEFLGVRNLVLVSSGTVALEIAYRALNLEGSIVTTPFSFVATASSMVWQGLSPTFCDVLPDQLTLDPDQIEAAIRSDCSAIVPVHVFGIPCNVEAIDEIADRNQLRLIYDAAHGFSGGSECGGLLSRGDVSIVSFHATKAFHCVEGGAVITNDDSLAQYARQLREFGRSTEGEFKTAGINAKMSELHAAMGMCVLDDFGFVRRQLQSLKSRYRGRLEGASSIQLVDPTPDVEATNGFVPVLLSANTSEGIYGAFERAGIVTRRYFSPPLHRLPYVGRSASMPVSEDVARRILCLPIHPGMSLTDVDRVCDVMLRTAAGYPRPA